MVHAIERVANNSETNSRHIEYLELMSQQIAKEVSKNRVGIEVAFIMLNINRMVGYIKDEIHNLNRVIEKLASHRLALGFVAPSQITAAIDQLTKIAASKQYHLAIRLCFFTYILYLPLFILLALLFVNRSRG